MGYFDDVDVDDIPDNPNELPNNTYLFQVIDAKVGPTKDGSKTGILFKYQIIEGPWSSFFPLADWVRVPDKNTKPDEIGRILSYLKMRLLAWGFTVNDIKAFGPGDEQNARNCRFYGTTSAKKDGDNTNFRIVKFDPLDNGVGDGIDEFMGTSSDGTDSF